MISGIACLITFAHCSSAGAVGVEMASETKMTWPKLDVKLIHSRQKLLSSEDLPDDFKDHTLAVLEETGVKVITGCRVIDTSTTKTDSTVPSFELTLSDGTKIPAGHVINARSTMIPSTTYFSPDYLDKDGYVKITSSYGFSEAFISCLICLQLELSGQHSQCRQPFCCWGYCCLVRYQASWRRNAHGPLCRDQYPSTDARKGQWFYS